MTVIEAVWRDTRDGGEDSEEEILARRCQTDGGCGRAGLARATAFDRLRVAHELRRRPALSAAFAQRRLSYSALRAATRATGASAEVDEALVAVAEAGTVADVERAVRVFRLHASQHKPLHQGGCNPDRPRGRRTRSRPARPPPVAYPACGQPCGGVFTCRPPCCRAG